MIFNLEIDTSEVELYRMASYGFKGFRKLDNPKKEYKPASKEENEMLHDFGNDLGDFYLSETLDDLIDYLPKDTVYSFTNGELYLLIPLTEEIGMLYNFGCNFNIEESLMF